MLCRISFAVMYISVSYMSSLCLLDLWVIAKQSLFFGVILLSGCWGWRWPIQRENAHLDLTPHINLHLHKLNYLYCAWYVSLLQNHMHVICRWYVATYCIRILTVHTYNYIASAVCTLAGTHTFLPNLAPNEVSYMVHPLTTQWHNHEEIASKRCIMYHVCVKDMFCDSIQETLFMTHDDVITLCH